MDAAEILAQLTFQERLPVEAIRAASADRAHMAPEFLRAVEEFLSRGGDQSAKDMLFFIFHLLGDWREKSAYRPLARLLGCPRDDLDGVFGDCITETTHRVMAAVFDGDPGPIYNLIRDPKADEFIRSRMLETIAMVTLNGELSRAEAARFLRECHAELEPQDESWMWHGWQSAIAMLGLAELKPLVEQAFARGLISVTWLTLKHFEEDLQQAIDNPDGLPLSAPREFTLFGDTIAELSEWHCFRPEEARRQERKEARWFPRPWEGETIFNPNRNVGRNDPCPCGSGLKFKKCCLRAEVGATALQPM
jgi:uncharacterized protein YecA (UPF0149 family)